MRFAFYGRVSTEDQQDPRSSKNWQLTKARQLVEPPGGSIVTQRFDIGQSRSLPWQRRPEAAQLLQDLANPARGFDAVVVGEPQRAFYGNQFGLTFPIFVHYDVQLWVPEMGGAVDPASDAHDILMNLYGGMSKGERNRIKTRVRTAMAAQAQIDGRFLGGRPPYGYQFADAGPHPNPSKASTGQRLKRLEPNPMTAPVVRRIFEQYATGMGLGTIAHQLTGELILCPSAADPQRNPHRRDRGAAWAASAVRAILTNPRYTGHQVWGRQRRHETLLDVTDVALGHITKLRRSPVDEWIWSDELAHPPLVSVELWDAVQLLLAENQRAATRTPRPGRHYVLASRVRCGHCGRQMEGSWNHDRPYYRCQVHPNDPTERGDHPRTIYVREDALLPGLHRWIGTLFDPEHLDSTSQALAAASQPDPEDQRRSDDLRSKIAELDRAIDGYRRVIREQPDTAGTVGRWIAECMQERKRLEYALTGGTTTSRLTAEDIKALVAGLHDICATIAQASPADREVVYAELGIHLTYHPDGRVEAESRPRVVDDGVGGGT